MAIEVKLPQLGQTMEEGTVVSCRIKEDDEVKRGDIIFEIETDKATLEMESPAEGFVKGIVVKEGQTILVGDLMLVLGQKDEKVDMSKYSPGDAESRQTEPQKKSEVKKTEESAGTIVKLPQLGQTMEEGTIVSVNIKIDDEVKRGDVVFEIETDKATLEMESPVEGFVKAVLVKEGETIPVGDNLLVIGNKDDVLPAGYVDSLKQGAEPATELPEKPSKVEQEEKKPVAAKQVTKTAGKVFASPRARKAAKEMGIDIAQLAGTGPNGRIIEKDVLKAAKSGTAGKPEAAPSIPLGSSVKLTRLQKITGQKMVESKRDIPCFYLNVKADVTDLVDFRAEYNKTSDVKVSYNDLIIKALADGIVEYPLMAGQLDGDSIKLADSIGVGLAIAVEDGLVAPVVKDCQKKDIQQIARTSREVIDKAKANKLGLDDLSGGCVTVSNLGAFGIDSFIPVVVPGQASILGVGQIAEECLPNGRGIAVRKMMKMTLSVDHRVINGAYASQFLDFVKKQLQDPINFK